MSEHLYLASLCLPLATILLVFGMRYVASVQQARAQLTHDAADRRLAEQAAAVGTDHASVLSSIQVTLADMTARLNAIEKILKDVG